MTYTHVAVFIHWVTAILIIGLLAVGRYMTGLEDADPLRFTLTQTHKTFGILVLLLSVIRMVWRLTHRAPPHPAHAPTWEKWCASLSHFMFYGLILALPLSGWAMVSVSNLNIDTLLFNTVKWPHLPIIEWLNLSDTAAKKAWEHTFHSAHHVAGNVLIVLLLVHVGAALKHHFINKDDVLQRMKPRVAEPGFWGVMAIAAIAVGAGAFALLQTGKSAETALVASDSSVSLLADVTGTQTPIEFSNSTVAANIDLNDPSGSSLHVTVDTASANTSNMQVYGSLPGSDWFDVDNYPKASFQSTGFAPDQETNNLVVTGDLSIKGTTLPVEFTLAVNKDAQSGDTSAAIELPINRFDYKIGLKSQANEDYVGSIVTIQVRFLLGTND